MKIKNDIPISSIHHICRLLIKLWGDETRRTLNRSVYKDKSPHIKIENCKSNYTNDDCIFYITNESFKYLRDKNYIVGQPYWGGRSNYEFIATEKLENDFWKSHGTICKANGDKELLKIECDHNYDNTYLYYDI